jgi:hypothetical protein
VIAASPRSCRASSSDGAGWARSSESARALALAICSDLSRSRTSVEASRSSWVESVAVARARRISLKAE